MKGLVLGAAALIAGVTIAACSDSPAQPQRETQLVAEAPSFALSGEQLDACLKAVDPDALCYSATFREALCSAVGEKGTTITVSLPGLKIAYTITIISGKGDTVVTIALGKTVIASFTIPVEQIAAICKGVPKK